MAKKRNKDSLFDSREQLDLMMNMQFMKLQKDGYTKDEVMHLCENLEKLRHMMVQKTGNEHYGKSTDIDFNDFETICNLIILYSFTVYMYGGYDKLLEWLDENDDEARKS